MHITIVHRIKTASVLEGESCTFECLLSHDVDDEPYWTINGQDVAANERLQVVRNGRKYKMAVRNAVITDAGDVVFSIKDLSCRAVLFVKGDLIFFFYYYFHGLKVKVCYCHCDTTLWHMTATDEIKIRN